MSLQDNVKYIKDEISTEEKFFESFFKLEKLWKNYKVAIISIASVVLIAAIGINVNTYLQTQNKIKANQAFNTFTANPQDTKAGATLKEINPQLFVIADYMVNKKDATNIQFLDNIAKYNNAVNNNDIESINKTILQSDFLLKEYAIFQKALMQTLNNNYKDAKETIKLIPDNSPISQLSNKLKHYLLTK